MASDRCAFCRARVKVEMVGIHICPTCKETLSKCHACGMKIGPGTGRWKIGKLKVLDNRCYEEYYLLYGDHKAEIKCVFQFSFAICPCGWRAASRYHSELEVECLIHNSGI